MLVPLLPHIVPESPDNGTADPPESAQNILENEDKMALAVAAVVPSRYQYFLTAHLSLDRAERR